MGLFSLLTINNCTASLQVHVTCIARLFYFKSDVCIVVIVMTLHSEKN